MAKMFSCWSFLDLITILLPAMFKSFKILWKLQIFWMRNYTGLNKFLIEEGCYKWKSMCFEF